MVKKFSTLALAGLIALPGVAAASSGDPSPGGNLEQQINELSRQLDELRAQMAKQGEEISAVGEGVEDNAEILEEKGPGWDLAARFKLYGDFRARYDYLDADTASFYSAFDVASALPMAMGQMGMGFGPYSPQMVQRFIEGMKSYPQNMRAGMFSQMGYHPIPAANYENDSMFTNRFRLNMRVKATENLEFKGRLAMYKAWGIQSNSAGTGPYVMDGFSWDGNMSRQPTDSDLLVDRAFLNWNNIGGAPVWFSIGRRPTTDGPPAQLRMGADKRMATPVNYMDYPFDGISAGYAYNWGNEAMGSGRIRLCAGRGFESGLKTDAYGYDRYGLNDMDFIGLSWDVLKKDKRFLNLQSFAAINLVNTPDGVIFPNPMELAGVTEGNGILDRTTLGNVYHSSAVYMDEIANFNFFLVGSWSRTDPSGYDEVGNSLLGSWWDDDLSAKDGFSFYTGLRYDIDAAGIKLGAEYNWGSENWISMSPGHDDLYNSKLATRGQVAELYMIYDLPTGEAISKFAKTFMRFGYQHYWYDYTGSGSWLGAPADIDALASDPLNAQFFAPVEEQDQVYVTFEAYF